jgi:hypothetical protein
MIMMAEGVGTNATQIKNVIAADKVGAARTTFNVLRVRPSAGLASQRADLL